MFGSVVTPSRNARERAQPQLILAPVWKANLGYASTLESQSDETNPNP